MKHYSIYVKTTELNKTHYQNANRFIKCIIVKNEIELKSKLDELNAANIEIIDIYNAIGHKIKF